MVITSVNKFLKKAKNENKTLGQIMIEHEAQVQNTNQEEVIDAMRKIWVVMVNSIKEGIKITERSPSGLSGGDAQKLIKRGMDENRLSGGTILRVTARAIGVGEYNSSMGTIVAAPTAGSSGVVPAVVFTAAERCRSNEEAIIRGLFASSLIGLVCDAVASTSGSEHGCQAEIGVSAAMAAAAAVEIAGGEATEAVNASALVLKNSLGLACDPIAGLVEVPCIKRNGFMAAAALVAADMSMCGIKSVVPFDDVVAAMNEIGQIMPCSIKETSEGGLAATKTGKKYEKWLKDEVKKQLNTSK